MFRLLCCCIVATFSSPCFSQSTQGEVLNEHYWSLRSDFLKRFVQIGTEDGQSIPIASLDVSDNYGTPCSAQPYNGLARFGDAPQLHGYYLATLATEYKLLKQNELSTSACLSELYYAIEAMNRLDRNAEFYLSEGGPVSLNGFLCRDDAPFDFMDEFVLNQYPITLDIRDLRYPCLEGDGYNSQFWGFYDLNGNLINPDAPFNRGNYMSQDHVFNLIMGCIFITKYVDNVYVKPTPSDPGFFLLDETRAIVSRMMNYIISEKTIIERTCWQPETSHSFTTTWSICNPITARREEPVSEVHAFVYPLAIAAQRVTGVNYMFSNVKWFYNDNLTIGLFCRPDLPGVPVFLFENSWEEVGSRTNYQYNYAYPSSFPLCWSTTQCLMEFTSGTTTTQPNLEMNAQLCALLATISGTWDINKLRLMSDQFDEFKLFDIMYASLNDITPARPQSFYESLLSSMPCDGAFNINRWNYSSPLNESYPWITTNFWNSTPPQGSDYAGSFGEFNGLDWMLLYNLYRIQFENGYSGYQDNSCPCDGSNAKIDLNINLFNDLTSSVILNRKFPAYTSFEIKLKEYLTHSLQIVSGNTLQSNTDLVVCNNSYMETQSNCTLLVGSSASDEGTVTFRKGSTLHLRSNSKLIIQDRCRVLIEEGAKIIYEAGAEIFLNGNNAVLEIQGTLELGPNALFKFRYPNFTSGYVKFSRASWVPYQPASPDYQIIAGAGSSIELIGANKNDKILEIAQSALWIPDGLDHFKFDHGLVEFAGNQNQNPILSIGCPIVQLTTARFIKAPNSNGGHGVHLYGQPNHTITNCYFEELGAGLVAENFYNIGMLKISACRFIQCGTGLVVYDKGVILSAVRFDYCGVGADLNGLTFNSTITNCKFNDNSEVGLRAKGSPIEIVMNGCDAKRNGTAGIEATGVTMNLACCDLRDNGIYAMILDYDASLRMSPVFNGGNNNLGNNQIPIILNEANQIEISGGRNKLKPDGPSCNGNPNQNCPDVFVGTIQTPCTPYVINAGNNEWKGNNNNSTFIWNSQQVTDLALSVNAVTAVGCTNVPVRFSDPSQQNFAQCTSGPNGPPGGGGPPNQNLSPLNNCTNCNSINTASFSNTPTDSAARTAIVQMDSTLQSGYSDAVGMFNEILMYPLPNETAEDKYVKKAARRKMHEALGEGIYRNQINYSSSTTSVEAAEVIQAEADEKDKGDQSGEYHRMYFAAMREAAAYRASGKRDVALQKFEDILTWVLPAEEPWTKYWVCLTSRELDVMTNQSPRENFFAVVQECIPVRLTAPALRLANGVDVEESDEVPVNELNASIFPNPASEVLTIDVAESENSLATFELYSATGQLVKTLTVYAGVQMQIQISDLDAGLYFYRLIGEADRTKEGRLVITH